MDSGTERIVHEILATRQRRRQQDIELITIRRGLIPDGVIGIQPRSASQEPWLGQRLSSKLTEGVFDASVHLVRIVYSQLRGSPGGNRLNVDEVPFELWLLHPIVIHQ